MSAFIVSRRHIDVLVSGAEMAVGTRGGYLLTWQTERGTWRRFPGSVSADELGRLLWAENLKSVAARYPSDQDGERPGPIGFRDADVATYVASSARRRRPLVEVLKALDCYEYQACESEGWATSEAFAVCQQIRRRLITWLPGYDAAPWEASERGEGAGR